MEPLHTITDGKVVNAVDINNWLERNIAAIVKTGAASDVVGGLAQIVGAIRRTDTTNQGLINLCDRLDDIQQRIITNNQLDRVWEKVAKKQESEIFAAHFSLTRLGGCHYKVLGTQRGNSLFFLDPQGTGKVYRIKKTDFTPDKYIIRGTWAITQWSEKSQRVAESERNWQS